MSDAGQLVLVCVGGGAGAGLRFGVGRLLAGDAFPWHTLGINAAGSLLLGVVAVGLRDRPGWAALLGAGLCGGFTTFSAFSLETVRLLEAGRPAAAVGYVLGSVAAGLAGVSIGLRLGRVEPGT